MSWLLFLDESGHDHKNCPYEVRGGVAIASIVPRTIVKSKAFEAEKYLRKDRVFLLERYFYFLETRHAHGLLVLDAVNKGADQRFVRQMER